MKFGLIEKQAAFVLKEFENRSGRKIDHPPVPINSIATICYGFGIGEQQFNDEISGELFLGNKIILVNLADPFVRRRFTVAHELGHLQLHTKKIDKEIIISRKSDAGHLEKEANAFAAALLMPKRLTYEYFIKNIMSTTGEDLVWLLENLAQLQDSDLNSINLLLFNVAFEDKIDSLPLSISNTAKAFQVSKDALSWRLKDFGLLGKLFSQNKY